MTKKKREEGEEVKKRRERFRHSFEYSAILAIRHITLGIVYIHTAFQNQKKKILHPLIISNEKKKIILVDRCNVMPRRKSVSDASQLVGR